MKSSGCVTVYLRSVINEWINVKATQFTLQNLGFIFISQFRVTVGTSCKRIGGAVMKQINALMLGGYLLLAAGAIAFQGTRPATTAKPTVNGEQNSVTITIKDGLRIIQSNGIPDHIPGQFPNRGNPNTIRSIQHSYQAPV